MLWEKKIPPPPSWIRREGIRHQNKHPLPHRLRRVYLYPPPPSPGGEVTAGTNMATTRSDRTQGNRGAYENARKKILATQTVCGICGKPVDFSYKYPHPLSPTVDHIIPVSKGGHPSDLSNLQLAHRCCNREKADKLVGRVGENVLNEEKLVPNSLLELHTDWTAYRAS